MITLAETNIAPENQWLFDEFPFWMVYVGFRECIFWIVPPTKNESLLAFAQIILLHGDCNNTVG